MHGLHASCSKHESALSVQQQLLCDKHFVLAAACWQHKLVQNLASMRHYCSMCACIAGPAVLTIRSADDIRALMDEMVQDGHLSPGERAFGEQWLERSCERQADGSVRTVDVLDGCTRGWTLGAYLGDGHIRETMDVVHHCMQVSTVPAAS